MLKVVRAKKYHDQLRGKMTSEDSKFHQNGNLIIKIQNMLFCWIFLLSLSVYLVAFRNIMRKLENRNFFN